MDSSAFEAYAIIIGDRFFWKMDRVFLRGRWRDRLRTSWSLAGADLMLAHQVERVMQKLKKRGVAARAVMVSVSPSVRSGLDG